MENNNSGKKLLFKHSIFLKLLLTMLGLGVILMVILFSFYNFFYGENLKTIIEHLINSHSQQIVLELGSPPDQEKAKSIALEQGIEIRYEGLKRIWTTSDKLPSISRLREMSGRYSIGHTPLLRDYSIISDADGGTFLLKWDFGWAEAAHREFLIMLLLFIVSVVAAAYFFIRRALKPIKALRQGVWEISKGNLDVQIPSKSKDELGALTESFNTMVQRVKEMVHARDQLLVDVSHELRSPLTRMKLALEFIPKSEKKQKLDQDVREVETMITEILEIERLKNNPGGLNLAKHDLADVCRQVTKTFEKRKPGVLFTNIPDNLLIKFDIDLVKIVLKNILENAFKFSRPDSHPVEFSLVGEAQLAKIEIKDDGQGIPEQEIPFVFEPFYRVDRSRSKKTGGYGLGLSICKKIMEAHGGQIECVNNTDRNGTSIRLVFPRSH